MLNAFVFSFTSTKCVRTLADAHSMSHLISVWLSHCWCVLFLCLIEFFSSDIYSFNLVHNTRRSLVRGLSSWAIQCIVVRMSTTTKRHAFDFNEIHAERL